MVAELVTDQWQLDARLEQDSYKLGYMHSSLLLLMKNALFPWFVVVPLSSETEFYKLDRESQSELLQQINLLSIFIKETFAIERLNTATIGNIVSQLHIHVVGRSHEDACWPAVVWGCKEFKSYDIADVDKIRDELLAAGLIAI